MWALTCAPTNATAALESRAMGVTRDHLYEQVWARPVRTVAAEYGVSSAALARICKRLNVPRPPRGYWAELKWGKPVVLRPPLPEARAGDQLEWIHDGEQPRLQLPARRSVKEA